MSQVFQAQAFKSNSETKKSFRVIGSVDIDGQGTEHPVHDVDPFVFLDETRLSGNEPWPFPKHPHSGLLAMTYLLEGEMIPWDNKQGLAPLHNTAGGLYWINSGQGIVHEEVPIYDNGPLRWLQLWMNPDIYTPDRPGAASGLIGPEDIPVSEDASGFVKVITGEFADLKSPLRIAWPVRILHVGLRRGRQTIGLSQNGWKGFAYVLAGEGTINGELVGLRDLAILDDETAFVIENKSKTLLEVVVASGQPHRKPFYKILGGGGALIEPSVQAAREAMTRYERDPRNFGRAVSDSPPSATDESSSQTASEEA